MNIDNFINNINKIKINNIINNTCETYILDLEMINPDNDNIYILLANNINMIGVYYIIEYNVKYKEDINENYNYIICKFEKNINDIITNIISDYKISIILENNTEIEIKDNRIMTLPILFMIYSTFKFKIYFKCKQQFMKDLKENKVIIRYNTYTLSNITIKNLNIIYKKHKCIVNNLGMTIMNGMINNNCDLDYY